MSKIKVLMVGPDYKTVKGGMSTVVKSYFEDGFRKHVDLIFIETQKNISKTKKIVLAIKSYFKILFEKDVDIIHINMAARGSFYRKSVIVILAKIMNKKCLIHLHGGAFKNFYENECNGLIKQYIKFIMNNVNLILVLSEEWKKILEEIGIKSNISVLNNGINIPQENPYKVENNEMIFMGKICEEKGIYDLIESIKYLKEEIPNIRLNVAGFGEVEKFLDIVSKYKLENNVKYLGWIDDNKKHDILKKSSIMILPSYYEAMPMSILEAMSYGVPCIATNVGGIPTLIDDGKDGLLIHAGNIEELTKKIRLLIYNSKIKKEYSEKSYIKCANTFDIKSVNKKLIKYYYSILN